VVASLSVGEVGRSAAGCEFTIRFPQVDPAGIVFYPRYFEMVYRAFPELPFANPPLAIRTRFLRPNRLGDRLHLCLETDDDWTVTGSMDGFEHFSMRSLAIAPPMPRAHADAPDAFTSKAAIVSDWMADRHGRMGLSRYFECLNIAIEEWFEATLGMPFHALHVGRDVGIPTVQFDTNLRRLPSFGESFSIRIAPLKLGARAMTFRSWLVCGDECNVENEQVVVFVRMLPDDYESIEIPDDVRDKFGQQLTERQR
jgi:4-hydroxybenzoyl-CoA thioesterase